MSIANERMRISRLKHTAVFLLGGLQIHCSETSAAPQVAPIASAPQTSASAEPVVAYPKATWRLARYDLHRVILKLSHILIRHKDASMVDSFLRSSGAGWSTDPSSARARPDAIVRATELSRTLRAAPARFAEEAKASSEDIVTAPWGGSLGFVRAADLPTGFLDAIAAMKPGEVSLPVESDAGIHILKLEVTPPPETIAATRIVISHDGSVLGRLRQGREVHRSRAEALSLAQDIRRQLDAKSISVADAVVKWTDNIDVDEDGDFGAWSTHDPHPQGLALEVITAVPVGGVAGPVESAEGFQIFVRTAAVERERFAAEYVWFTPERTQEVPQALAAIRADHRAFDRYRDEVCCEGVREWAAGRGLGRAAETKLSSLKDNEIGLEPIETIFGVYILKRRLPSDPPRPEPLASLPSPTEPDLRSLLKHVAPEGLVRFLVSVRLAILPTLSYPPEKLKRVQALVDRLGSTAPDAEPEARSIAESEFWTDAGQLLSAEELDRLNEAMVATATQALMQEN